MKKMVMTVAVLALAFACVRKVDSAAKPVSEKGEKVYAMKGKITGRTTADNSLTIDHEAIPGFMEAMTMGYTVRGAKVETLPGPGAKIGATLHVTDSGYWITDVHPAP